MNPITTAQRSELAKLQNELAALCNKQVLMRSDGKRIDALVSRISAIRFGGLTESEARTITAHEKLFRRFMTGASDQELHAEYRASEVYKRDVEKRGTDLLAGSGNITYTQGPSGGFIVPPSFMEKVTEGLAAVNPLLDPSVATVVQEKDFRLLPLQIPGWDLSTLSAVQVGETVQHASDVAPGLSVKSENKFTYRLSLGASLEFEQDSAIDPLAAMGRAFGIGFARGIGVDLVTGNGTSAPQGVLTGAASSGYTTAASGVLSATDFTAIYFKVNKAYRDSERCAWLMSDPVYQMALNAKDSSGRPLINIWEDQQRLLGKPVYVCPSLPSANGSSGGILFGDLSHYIVHASSLLLRRRLQTAGYVEVGKALYTGLMMVDAVVFDPTAGAMPPIVSATLHV